MKVISVVGYKGTGKTTLVTQLVKTLSKRGKVGTVKQMFHHRFNPKNTDTGKHFDAGAEAVVALTDSEPEACGSQSSLSKALDAPYDGLGLTWWREQEKQLTKDSSRELENINEIKNVVSRLPSKRGLEH